MAEPLIKHLALVSESTRVSTSRAMIVAAALQKQAVRDLAPIWNTSATVQAFETLEDVPLDYWPIIIRDDIGYDAAGIHLDEDGQPFALVTAHDEMDVWSLTASHESLEMLVDPMGDRLVAGDSPKPDQGRVLFLVEVCDPSEAAEFAYSVNGVLVSDFYTPHFFDPVASVGVRYSFTDAISEPRDVLRGGYLSWLEPESRDWWQETWFGGSSSRFRKLGPLTTANGSIRTQIDSLTGKDTYEAVVTGRSKATVAGLQASRSVAPATARAASLHMQIDKLAKPAKNSENVPEKPSSARRRAPSRRRP